MNNFDANTARLLAQSKNFFIDTWENISDFFTSYKFRELVFDIKLIFIAVSVLLLMAIIFLLAKIVIGSMLAKPLIKPRKPKPAPIFNKKKIRKRWDKIEKRVSSGLEANYKLALLEADKVFNGVIKELGYGIEKKLGNADDIKAADKLKNKLIEDKKLKLSKEEAEKSVEAYKKGLKELGML